MMCLRRSFLAAIVLLLSFSMVACSTSQIILDIEIASTAIEIGAPVVAAFSGPGAALVLAYMNSAASGLNCVLMAAQAPMATTATISAAVASCLAASVVPNIPGLPANVQGIITAVANAIKHLIEAYGPKLAAGGTPRPVKLGFADHRKIHSIQKQLAAAQAKLKK
jgi:hypothetical protein